MYLKEISNDSNNDTKEKEKEIDKFDGSKKSKTLEIIPLRFR